MRGSTKRSLVLAILLAASGCVADPGAAGYDAGRPYDYGQPWDYGPGYYPPGPGFYRGERHDWDHDWDRGRDHDRGGGERRGGGGPLGLPNPMRPFGHFP